MDTRFFQLQTDNTSLDYLNNQLEKLKLCRYKNVVIDNLLHQNPDLASFFLYGNSAYYWVLLYVNDMDSFDEFKKGIKIKCPLLSDLNKVFNSL